MPLHCDFVRNISEQEEITNGMELPVKFFLKFCVYCLVFIILGEKSTI